MRILILIGTVILFLFLLYRLFKSNNVKTRLESLYDDDLPKIDVQDTQNASRLSLPGLKVSASVRNDIENSGLNLKTDEFLVGWVLLAVVPPIVLSVFDKSLLTSILFSLVGAVAPPMILKISRNKRRSQFSDQLGGALLLIANGIRSGFSFEQTLNIVAQDMGDPISGEFKKLIKELNLGYSLEQALTALGQRMENADIELLTSAVMIQRQVGGNLAEIMDTLADTIQERVRLKNKIKTLTAQGKISGLVVGLLPVVLILALNIVTPGYMDVMFVTDFGKILLGIGGLMEGLGFLIIRNMVNI